MGIHGPNAFELSILKNGPGDLTKEYTTGICSWIEASGNEEEMNGSLKFSWSSNSSFPYAKFMI
jgi:hypothetical protein